MAEQNYHSLVLITTKYKPIQLRPLVETPTEIYSQLKSDINTNMHYYGAIAFAEKDENLAQFLIQLTLQLGIKPDFQLICKNYDLIPQQLIDFNTKEILVDYTNGTARTLYKSKFELLNILSELK